MMSGIILNIVVICVIVMKANMINVIMHTVDMMNVVVLNVAAPLKRVVTKARKFLKRF